MTEIRQAGEKLIPAKVSVLPPKFSKEPLIRELTAAYAAVGELRGYLSTLPNPDLLIAPFRKREAVASSAIEGTTATLQDVLEFEAIEEIPNSNSELTKKFQDIREVKNYEKAMGVALKETSVRPIGETLLKKTHGVLLNSVRGASKDRGNFRRDLVRVGAYIPPVCSDIPMLMSNWEKYLNSDIEFDTLIRIGVAHYQFEAIHPFLDGNGRIGRLIIPLFLCHAGALQAPVLYISHYLEQHKVEYQRLLHKVDTDQEWIPWLKFFLVAIESQANQTTQMAKDIQNLYEKLKKELSENIRSQHTIAILDAIFTQPYFVAKSIQGAISAKSRGTTYNILQKFVRQGVLKEIKNFEGRESLYVFSDLMRILNA